MLLPVGGFSNSASLAAARRKGVTYGTWLGSRLRRLVRPVLAFAVVWTTVAAVMVAAGVDPGGLRAGWIAQPLWFLAVYVVVVALAPVMVAAQERWGAAVTLALGGAVLAIDIARWGFGVPMVGWLNLGLVWLFAHQLGVAWRMGSVGAWSRGRVVAMAAAGMGILVVLTSTFGYPGSMVGGVEGGRTNTFPPSFAIVALALWQFGAVLALRPVVDRWLARPRVWTTVVAANGMAMTLYLWHLTALVIVTAAVLPAGLLPSPRAGPRPGGPGARCGCSCWRPPWSPWSPSSPGSRRPGFGPPPSPAGERWGRRQPSPWPWASSPATGRAPPGCRPACP